MREPITAEGAPDAVGPYVHAVKAAGLVFVSGQIPLDPESGELVGETAAEQADQVLKNLTAIVEAQDAAEATLPPRAPRAVLRSAALTCAVALSGVASGWEIATVDALERAASTAWPRSSSA